VNDAITALHALENDLLAALDAEDTGAVAALVTARGEALDALRHAFDDCEPGARQQFLPELQRLAEGDAVLGARCRALRDSLQSRLQKQDLPHSGGSQPVVTGVFDRQA